MTLFSNKSLVLAMVAGCTGAMICVTSTASAAPMLSLRSTTGAASLVRAVQPTLELDLYLDTDGIPASGLQYFLSAPLAFYASPVVTALVIDGTFFDADDLAIAPLAGAAVERGSAEEGVTVWFKSAGNDYAAFDGAMARYTFDSSLLAAGSTYTFTPVLQEISNSLDTVTTFAPASGFSLTVVPEPSSVLALVAAFGVLQCRSLGRRSNA